VLIYNKRKEKEKKKEIYRYINIIIHFTVYSYHHRLSRRRPRRRLIVVE
jgi:hypothetical protein